MPLENQLLEEVLKSNLLNVDETPWQQKEDLLWLWIFVSSSVVAFSQAANPIARERLPVVSEKEALAAIMGTGNNY